MLRLKTDASNIDDFNDNYCQIIVDKMAGRLQVTEISTGDDALDKGWLSFILQRNMWKAIQGTVFAGAVRDGESFMMIDPQTLLWSSEPAYDGFDGIVALFDSFSRTPIWACKLWAETVEGALADTEESTMRLVVYQPDVVTYWVGKEGGDEVEPDKRITTQQVINMENGFGEVQDTLGNRLPWAVGSVPIIHFVNRYSNYSSVGKSEVRPAIPLQDVLNRTIYSMVMASEFSAFRIKWSIGIPIDASGIVPGAVINLVLKDEQGNVLTSVDENEAKFLEAVKVGEFEETDISQYITQIDKLAREISQIAQTPIYGVTTEGVLSGEALKQLEIGLIGKCERFQNENTDAIKELIQLTAAIQNTFTLAITIPPVPKVIQVTVVNWKPAELLDVAGQIAVLIQMRKEAPGLWDDEFYRTKIGALLGMAQAQVKEESLRAQQQQQDVLETLVGAAGVTQPVI